MSIGSQVSAPEIQITAPITAAQAEILSPEALEFVGSLVSEFEGRRQELLERRRVRQADIDAGQFPDFLPETAEFDRRSGPSRPFRPTCWTAAWRSPAR